MIRFRYLRCHSALLGALCIHAVGTAAALPDRREDAAELGTTVQYVVPLAALAFTFILQPRHDDDRVSLDSRDLFHLNGSPRHDLALAVARAALATDVLKEVVNEKRPNGGHHSFPSGHTSFVFSGAEFIRKEYGWGWGTPAYLAAGFVGWSRVEGKAHHPHDVAAGALIGILANHDYGEIKTRYGWFGLQPAAIETSTQSVPSLQLRLTFPTGGG